MVLFNSILLLSSLISSPPQGIQPDVQAQKAAMKKLDFLVGSWKGDALVRRGPGAPIKIIQTENIQYKLDGLVLQIEGEGKSPEGNRVFGALATITYEESTKTYRFRAFNEGRYLETEITVDQTGFSWGYTSGLLKVSNTMKLNSKHEWIETTESTYAQNPPQRSVEMILKKVGK